MSLRSAAFLAFIAMILVTALLLMDLFLDISNVMNGLIPAVRIFRALIYAFAALMVTIYFFAAYRKG